MPLQTRLTAGRLYTGVDVARRAGLCMSASTNRVSSLAGLTLSHAVRGDLRTLLGGAASNEAPRMKATQASHTLILFNSKTRDADESFLTMHSNRRQGRVVVNCCPAMTSKAPSSASGSPQFDPIEDAVADIKAGKFVIVLDDENRENEGDLIVAADKITTEQMAWFIRHTSGFICISLHPALIEQLAIPMMVPHNTERNRTAYTVTLDYRHGTTTGISAHDRALTSRKLAEAWRQRQGNAQGALQSQANGAGQHIAPHDFCRPGHMCPLRYTEGGVRRRRGHTEASVDLCQAAELPPVALLCELVDSSSDDGRIASRDACFAFAREHNLKVVTIESLVAWREQREGQLQEPTATSTALDKERGVRLSKQDVVGPAIDQ